MGLELRGHLILTEGEYLELARLMPPDASAPSALVAMKVGGSDALHPMDVFSALDIESRIASASGTDPDAANVILERGLDRLSAAFPTEVPA